MDVHFSVILFVIGDSMSKPKSLMIVWVLMIAAVITQVFLAKYIESEFQKTATIVAVSFILTFLSGYYFMDLRSNTKYLTLMPIIGFLIVLSLIIGAIAGS